MFVIISVSLLAFLFVSCGLLLGNYCYNYNYGSAINELEVTIGDSISIFGGAIFIVGLTIAVSAIMMFSIKKGQTKYISFGVFLGTLVFNVYAVVHSKIYVDEFIYNYQGEGFVLEYSIHYVLFVAIVIAFYSLTILLFALKEFLAKKGIK